MKNIEIKKKCNGKILREELEKAGFQLFGVSTSGEKTIIHLKEEELKDPSEVAYKHIYKEPIINKPIKIEKVAQKLIDKGIITSRADLE
jgi:hypothetical protein